MNKVGVLRFPGTNCDRDIWQAVETVKAKPEWLWHTDRFGWKDYKALVIPGGFSYGDYLRTGALAAMSPVMKSLKEAIDHGVPVIGICNGFQILCEARILPGALLRNEKLKFQDKWVQVKVENNKIPWSANFEKNRKVRLPIAHGDGRYYADSETLKKIEDRGQVWCRYLDNPNGSLNDIAGVVNDKGNVVALMPHPERAIFDWMGSNDGIGFFNWL